MDIQIDHEGQKVHILSPMIKSQLSLSLLLLQSYHKSFRVNYWAFLKLESNGLSRAMKDKIVSFFNRNLYDIMIKNF